MTTIYYDYNNQNYLYVFYKMNIDKSLSNHPDTSIEKIHSESWVWVYRILALMALWVAWYGSIKYTTDEQMCASVDEIAKKVWNSYMTLMTHVENPGTRWIPIELKNIPSTIPSK